VRGHAERDVANGIGRSVAAPMERSLKNGATPAVGRRISVHDDRATGGPMNRPRFPLALVVLGVCLPVSADPKIDTPAKPVGADLVEKATVRLAQVDVTVAGRLGAQKVLDASDFTLRVGDRTIDRLLVDFVCSAATPSAAVRAPTYVLYFDQRHLTVPGRRRALGIARDLVRAGTLGPGDFVYEVRMLDGDQELGRGERKFRAAEPAPGIAAAPSRWPDSNEDRP
jgi:hypothetical protein